MKVSFNSIKNILGRPITDTNILVNKIGEQLGAVEEVVDLGKKYKEARIVRVVSCTKHQNADSLSVCLIDDGESTPDVERNENGLVQVVCGAPNVHAGMLAVWLAPGTTVPDSIDNDPFILGARELRGVMSNGMLASLKELSLGDDHTGIVEVDVDKTPGQLFGDAYNLTDDVVIDIENKMFTHRPDCFGFLGVAREIAGIQQLPFKSPDWYTLRPEFPGQEADLSLSIDNQVLNLAPRFSAITMADVEVKPSPLWLKIELAKVGIKSINNIVDYTNFFMALTGQPLHAYDYDKVKSLSSNEAALVIRTPRENEEITLLNGKTITPRAEAVMIATDQKLIGFGGVMGGVDTEVDENTRNIILECANFDMYSIRKTSMEHGLFTDAVTRFNKGQSPLQTAAVLAKIVDEIKQYAGGKVASGLQDVHGDFQKDRTVHVRASFINERLGLELSAEEIKLLLENVEFGVEVIGNAEDHLPSTIYHLRISVPFWRTDIEIPEDVVEEVGRLYGFDKLKRELPTRSISPVQKDKTFAIKSQVRSTLAKYGANEVLTYSFVHGDLLEKVGQDKNRAFKLSNALSPDLQYYRLSLTPSLLDKVHSNIKTGYGEFALFEIGKSHHNDQTNEDGLPTERERLAFVLTADDKFSKDKGAAYYRAKRFLQQLVNDLGVKGDIVFEPLEESTDLSATVYYEQGRAATIKVDEVIIGRIGEYKASVRKALKLPEYTAGFELGLEPLLGVIGDQARYHALPKFPKVTQDITLKIDESVAFSRLASLIGQEIAESKPEAAHTTIEYLGIFQPDNSTNKNISFRISLASFEKTMREQDLSKILDAVAVKAKDLLSADRV